jgi:hypothetical protein
MTTENIINLEEGIMVKPEVLEEALRVQGLKLGFKQLLPNENFTDAHQALPIFGTHWGRGVLTSHDGHYDALVGSYGSSHAELKKHLESGERTEGTFYYGYDGHTKTLYLDYATDRTFEFNNKTISAIVNALKLTSGFFHGMIIG